MKTLLCTEYLHKCNIIIDDSVYCYKTSNTHYTNRYTALIYWQSTPAGKYIDVDAETKQEAEKIVKKVLKSGAYKKDGKIGAIWNFGPTKAFLQLINISRKR